MKKTLALILAFALILSLGIGITVASGTDGVPAAKATAQIAELNIVSAVAVGADEVDWDADGDLILEQQIKTANNKDLFIDVSLLSGLYTETNVKSNRNTGKDTSGAAAAALVAVFVDDEMVYPGYPIVMEGRVQVLSAELNGILNEEGEVVGNESIGLIIGTLSANSFNFIAPDLDAGVHTVKVYAATVSGAFAQQGSAAAVAAIGLGSVTVEEVRMVKGEQAILD